MPSSALIPQELPAVTAQLSYLAATDGPMQVRVYPLGSGLTTQRPASVQHQVPIHDARPIADQLRLDEQGFELRRGRSEFTDFYQEAVVRERYYPEVQRLVQEAERLLT